MKRVRLTTALVLVAAVAGWTHPAMAQPDEEAEPRLITVTGEGEVKVMPDEAVFTLGIETSDKDLGAAKSANDARIRQVLDLADKAGIDPQDVQTDHLNIEPRYRDGYEQRDFIAYFVRKNVVIRLKDLSKYESFFGQVLQLGVNYVYGINFQISEPRKYKDQARLQAIRAAQDKATSLASQLNQDVGQPYKIVEDQETLGAWNQSRGAMMMPMDSGGTGGPTIAPGQILVTARVTVSFELVSRAIQ